MAFSSTVSPGDTILAANHNNIRLDILDLTGGHDHDGIGSSFANKKAFSDGSNILIGIDAGRDLTSGLLNYVLGDDALLRTTTGGSNVAIGSESMRNNLTGVSNVAIGVSSLRGVSTSGGANVAIGESAVSNISTGNLTTGIGYRALQIVSTGVENTALGANALNLLTTGSNNIGIGFNAQVAVATNSNQIRMGNTSITLAEVQVAWTVTSDRKFKENIKSLDLGLEFILQLEPVEYFRKKDESKKKEYGLIAQDLEKILENNEIDSNGMISTNDKGEKAIRYNDLIAILIKATQEQQDEIEQLKARLVG